MSNRLPEEGEDRSPREASAASDRTSPLESLVREARRLLASRSYEEVIRRLEVHRPAEWAVVDETTARLLRLLGQAHLGQKDWMKARDCLEHLRGLQQEKAVLSRNDHAAALSDLCKCYRELNLNDLAEQCQQEARRLLQSE